MNFGQSLAKSGPLLLVLAWGYSAQASEAERAVFFPNQNVNSPISAAVKVGDVLYLSGQIGTDQDGVVPETIEEETKLAMDKIAAVLKRAELSMDHVFKCSVMLTDISSWETFNQVYTSYFKPGRMPARSAFGVNELVRGARLEVECMAHAPSE